MDYDRYPKKKEYEDKPGSGSLHINNKPLREGQKPEQRPSVTGSNLLVECPHCQGRSIWLTSLFRNIKDGKPWWRLTLTLNEKKMAEKGLLESVPGEYNQSRSKPEYEPPYGYNEGEDPLAGL